MHREDLHRMLDGWISITEEVRADPDAWKLSGDIFTKKAGDKPWIAEMYGYSYSAARANIWHHTDNRYQVNSYFYRHFIDTCRYVISSGRSSYIRMLSIYRCFLSKLMCSIRQRWAVEDTFHSVRQSQRVFWEREENYTLLSVCRVMLYPGYSPTSLREAPNILHYGVNFGISQEEPKIDFQFDKHWYREFEPLSCYPWEKRDKEGRSQSGLFPSPPHPSKLRSTGLDLLRDLLVIETVATLNEALCLRHTRNCPPSTELDAACRKVLFCLSLWIKVVRMAVTHLQDADHYPLQSLYKFSKAAILWSGWLIHSCDWKYNAVISWLASVLR